MVLYWQCSDELYSNNCNCTPIDKDDPVTFNFIRVDVESDNDNKSQIKMPSKTQSDKPRKKNGKHKNCRKIPNNHKTESEVSSKGKIKHKNNDTPLNSAISVLNNSYSLFNYYDRNNSNQGKCQGNCQIPKRRKGHEDIKNRCIESDLDDLMTVSLESKCNTLACLNDLEDEECILNDVKSIKNIMSGDNSSPKQEKTLKSAYLANGLHGHHEKDSPVLKSSCTTQEKNPKKKSSILKKIWRRIRSGKKKSSPVHQTIFHFDENGQNSDCQVIKNPSCAEISRDNYHESGDESSCSEELDDHEINQNAHEKKFDSENQISTVRSSSVNSVSPSKLGEEETSILMSKLTSCKLCSIDCGQNKTRWESGSNLTAYRSPIIPVISKQPSPNTESRVEIMSKSRSSDFIQDKSQTSAISKSKSQTSLSTAKPSSPENVKSLKSKLESFSRPEELKAFTDSVFYSSAAIVLSILEKIDSLESARHLIIENKASVNSRSRRNPHSLQINSNIIIVKKSFNAYFGKLINDYPSLSEPTSTYQSTKENFTLECDPPPGITVNPKISSNVKRESISNQGRLSKLSSLTCGSKDSENRIKNVSFSRDLNNRSSSASNRKSQNSILITDEVKSNRKRGIKSTSPQSKSNMSEETSENFRTDSGSKLLTIKDQTFQKSSLDHLCSDREPSEADSEVEYLERTYNSKHGKTGLPNTDFVAFMDSLFGSLLSKSSLKERTDATQAYFQDIVLDNNSHVTDDSHEVSSSHLDTNSLDKNYAIKDKQMEFKVNNSKLTDCKELLFILRSYKILTDVISRTSTELIKRCKYYENKSLDEIKMSLVKKYVSENHPSRTLYLICNQNNTSIELISKDDTKPYQVGDWNSKRMIVKGKSFKKVVKTLESIRAAIPFFLTCLKVDWENTTTHDKNYILKNFKDLKNLIGS